VKARQANVAQQEALLIAAQDRVKDAKKILDHKQLDLKTSEQKIVDYRVKLNGASSNREYQTLVEQIAAAEMANSVLADEILEGMDKIDQLAVQVKEAETALAAVKNDLLKYRDSVAAESAIVQGDITRLEAELAEAEKNLPATLKDDYRRVIQGKGAEGMASVEDMVCQGCGQQITLNMQNDLLLSRPIFCKSCGSLLYLAE
jgi:predicted  nucleic acid-binding Zn-ribbon protein